MCLPSLKLPLVVHMVVVSSCRAIGPVAVPGHGGLISPASQSDVDLDIQELPIIIIIIILFWSVTVPVVFGVYSASTVLALVASIRENLHDDVPRDW